MTVNQVSSSAYTQQSTGLKNMGKGVSTNIKLFVPILSSHTVGDYFSRQKETAENLNGTQDGEKDGFLRKTVKGFGRKLLYALPIIGTYQLGKNKIKHENLKEQIEAKKNDTTYKENDAGVIKTYFIGCGEKIKNLIPVYGTYYKGKMMNENENMYKDSQIIAAQNASKDVETA